jgi:hypothetical protein
MVPVVLEVAPGNHNNDTVLIPHAAAHLRQ